MFHARLSEQADHRSQSVAIGGLDGRELSYGDLPLRIGAVQHYMATQGIGLADVVGVAMTNGPELAVTLLGASLSASLSPLDPDLDPAELCAILIRVGARVLITDPQHLARILPIAEASGIRVLVLPFTDDGPLGSLAGHPERPMVLPPDSHVYLLHRTSGTTGTSKGVPLCCTNLGIQAKNTAESLGLTEQDRIVNVMPLFHMHGFGCLSGTLWSGGSIICTPGHDGGRYSTWLRTFKPTWFSASPVILNDLVRLHMNDPRLKEQVPFRFIRSLSAAIPYNLAEELERLTVAPLVEQYGLTEALSPVIANHPPPGTRKLGSIGRPYRNEVRIVDIAGHDRPVGTVGEITLKGAGIIDAYAGSEEANASAWSNGWLRTGDLGYQDKDGYIFVTGRSKEEINRGGEKIGPVEVEAALLGHPDVKQAAAFAMPHPTLGEEVALAYVPNGATLDPEDLRAYMLERIAAFKVPKQFFPVSELPLTATGKVKRSELTKLLIAVEPMGQEERPASIHTELYEKAVEQALAVGDTVHGSEDPKQLPADYVERTVAMVWCQELRLERVLLCDDFFVLGGDSLSGVRICARLRDMLGCRVELMDLFRNPQLRRFAAQLGRLEHGRRWLNLAPIRTSGSSTPFICVHGDEGNYNLPRLLGEDRPFIGFMHQGEDGLGMRYRTIGSMAHHYVNELIEAVPQGPYVMAGFSTGGVIAYEMAQRLKAMGEEVPLLILLDTRGPVFDWWRYAPRTKLADLRSIFLRPRCERYLEQGRPIPFKLRNFFIINTYRRALERYRPKPYTGKVLLVRSWQRSNEPTGWQGLLSESATVKVVPGEHFTILREPHARAVVSAIDEQLRSLDL